MTATAERVPLRLFVAVIPPATAIHHLESALAELAEADNPGSRSIAGLRWVQPDAWHLTLAFLGAVGTDKVDELSRRLGRAAGRAKPFSLSIKGAGRFGNRVVWAGIAGDRAELVRLATSASAAARRCGVPVEDRPYRPHLTLARGVPELDLRPTVEALAGYDGLRWPAETLHLVESRLGAGPGRTAEHRVLRSWRLGGEGEPA